MRLAAEWREVRRRQEGNTVCGDKCSQECFDIHTCGNPPNAKQFARGKKQTRTAAPPARLLLRGRLAVAAAASPPPPSCRTFPAAALPAAALAAAAVAAAAVAAAVAAAAVAATAVAATAVTAAAVAAAALASTAVAASALAAAAFAASSRRLLVDCRPTARRATTYRSTAMSPDRAVQEEVRGNVESLHHKRRPVQIDVYHNKACAILAEPYDDGPGVTTPSAAAEIELLPST